MRGAIPGTLKFAFRYSFAQSTRRILRSGSSSKIKMRVSRQRRAIKNFEMYVSLQRCAQKCMKQVSATSAAARCVQKSSFYHSFGRPTSTKERVRGRTEKFACHHSFERPTITFCVKGCLASFKICISAQF